MTYMKITHICVKLHKVEVQNMKLVPFLCSISMLHGAKIHSTCQEKVGHSAKGKQNLFKDLPIGKVILLPNAHFSRLQSKAG